jgi:two-component system chemotaxis sensor kinase CheA
MEQTEMAVFLEELNEKIQIMDENILSLEKGTNEPKVIEEIFRAVHTIKGSSAMMGYTEITNLAHEIENVFDKLRRGALQITTPLIDTLLETLDALKQCYLSIAENIPTQISVASVINKLKALLETKTKEKVPLFEHQQDNQQDIPFFLNQSEENIFYEAKASGREGYWINIKLDPACQMKTVRAFLILETLKQKGDIVKCIPSIEEVQEGRFNTSFATLLLSAEKEAAIKNLLLSISEVSNVNIQAINLEEYLKDSLPDEKQKTTVSNKEENVNIKTVRVDVLKLDILMNLVGELLIEHTRLKRFTSIMESNKNTLTKSMQDISNHIAHITNDLQEEIMKIRMLPVAYLFNRFPRMVRDIAHKLGKEIDFVIEGQQTELDRNIIEAIGNPLIHLLRNAIDHGVELPEERVRLGKPRTGTVKLKAAYLENQIVITISDDGQGIKLAKIKNIALNNGLLTAESTTKISDRELLNLIFLPGFSTREVVNDVSGRGVGMDIVRKQIEQVNGTIEIFTQETIGTTLTIKLPLTLAIVRALLVEIYKQVYVFPLANVSEIILVKPEEIKWIGQNKVIEVRHEVLPLVEMADYFNYSKPKKEERFEHTFVVILSYGGQKIGMIVDDLLGEQEIVIKPLGEYLKNQRGFTGATILGDGQPALIVDVRYLVESLGKNTISILNDLHIA